MTAWWLHTRCKRPSDPAWSTRIRGPYRPAEEAKRDAFKAPTGMGPVVYLGVSWIDEHGPCEGEME